ncbi:HlyD family secretion protein [Spirosoma arcticum]
MKTNTFLLLSALSLTTLLTACESGQETDNAQLQSDISPVIPKVNGTVMAIRTDDNQHVRQGDTLALLDDRDLRLRVQQAEIALEQAQANVSVARRNTQAASIGTGPVSDNSAAAIASIAAAQEGVKAADVRVRQATLNFNRQEQLLAQESTPRQVYDNVKAEKEGAEAGLRVAQAQVAVLQRQASAARRQVTTAQTQVGVVGEGIRVAELAVKQARTNLENARLQLSYTVITAPTAGIVSDKSIQLGQVVSVGQTLLKVADDRKTWVVANFKETQMAEMRVGQPVEVNVDAYPDKTFRGRVESVSPATGARFSMLPPDNATGNFVKVTQRVPVRIAFAEAADASTPLRAGMSVSVLVKDKI